MDIDIDEAKRLAHKILLEGTGFTYPRPPSKGYMVGGGSYEDTFDWQKYVADLLATADIETMKLRLANRIVEDAKHIHAPLFVGGWYNGQSGEITIEGASHFYTLDGALRWAKKWKQKCIFNLTLQKEVAVD